MTVSVVLPSAPFLVTLVSSLPSESFLVVTLSTDPSGIVRTRVDTLEPKLRKWPPNWRWKIMLI